MKNENEKKGLLSRLLGGQKEKTNSCCGGFRIEEIPEESAENKDAKVVSKPEDNCCNK